MPRRTSRERSQQEPHPSPYRRAGGYRPWLHEKIAELENLTASEDDINGEYARIAEAYGIDVEQVKASIDSEFIAADMKVKLALDAVKEKAVVKASKKKATKKVAPKAEAVEGEEKPVKKTRKTTKKATEEAEA